MILVPLQRGFLHFCTLGAQLGTAAAFSCCLLQSTDGALVLQLSHTSLAFKIIRLEQCAVAPSDDRIYTQKHTYI